MIRYFIALSLALSPLLAAPSAAQTAQEGYLLAGKLHAEPDSFSDEVGPVSREVRVRVVPVEDAEGWHAVYRAGESQPAGYAFRPFVSRLGSSELAALQSDDAPLAQAESEEDDGKLPGVVFAGGLTEADGVLVQVEQWANVRTGPGIGHEAFGVIRPETPFRVLEIDRGWGKIQLEGEHAYGYVSGSLLHRVEEPVAEASEPEEEPGSRTTFTIGGASAGGAATLGEAAEAEEAPGLEETTGIVYVTRTGHKYHRADCKHLRSVKFAMPLAEAMLDFAPCRTCTPPTSLPEDLPEDEPLP